MPLLSTLISLIESPISDDTSANKTLYVLGDMHYSYQDMLNRVAQLQQYLYENSAPKDNIVVSGHKEFDMYCLAIACVVSNRRFIPVDNSLDNSRLTTIIDICRPALIFNCTGENCSVDAAINTDAIEGDFTQISQVHLPAPDDIAYIIFTSGTTGTPKGVQVSIEALEDFLEWTTSKFFNFSEQEVFVNHALYSFDLSVFELWTALATQNSILALTHDNNTNSRKNIRQLAGSEATCFVATPSFIELLLLDWKFSANSIPTLKAFVFCGEILQKSTVKALNERFPNATIFNLYGPTEATCATTGVIVTSKEFNSEGALTVGKVKPDTSILIDEATKEVIISGENVAHGYINVPHSDAFFEHNGVRAYRTGDAGYLDSDGQLFITGRIDRQVKLHGYRIELDEIEHHLNQVIAGQVAVLAIYNQEKVIGICAYLASSENISLEDIHTMLANRIPTYMFPTVIKSLEVMPLNANGKIDRKALAAI